MYVFSRMLMENKNMPSLAQYRVLLFQLIHANTEPLLAYSGLVLDTCWPAYARCEVATIEPMQCYYGITTAKVMVP